MSINVLLFLINVMNGAKSDFIESKRAELEEMISFVILLYCDVY